MNRFTISFVVLMLFLATANGQGVGTKVITGATLIDSTGRPPITDAAIVIEGTRITQVGARSKTQIPKGAQIIDAQGKFVIPGLADAHVHLTRATFDGAPEGMQPVRKNLTQLFAWGITTIFDTHFANSYMKFFATLRNASADSTVAYPRFFSTGPMLTAKGGWGSQLAGLPVDTPAEARAMVRELKASNVNAVKMAYDDMRWITKQLMPVLQQDVMAAIIDEAHKQGLKAYVHAPILDYAKEALRAGVDGLVHGIISDPVDEEFITLMKRNHATYITTFAVFEDVGDTDGWVAREEAFDDRQVTAQEAGGTLMSQTIRQWQRRWNNTASTKEHLPILRANLKKLFDAGVPVVIGTDTGVPGVLFGVATHLELLLHVQAGLKPMDVIRAATINVARMIGQEKDLGSVEPGKLADLVILDADPLSDIRNTRRIYRVVKGGVVYDPRDIIQQLR